MVEEFEKYRIGDYVFSYLLTSDVVGYGKIRNFHLESKMGPAFSFWDEISGGFRTTLIKNIIDNPTKKEERKLTHPRAQRKKRK